MNLALLIPEPHLTHLKFINQTIQESGHECYLVGGSVRDLYMNKIPSEYDLTTSASPDIIKSRFKSVIETGIKHGTVTILLDRCPYEITTYRIDKDYTDGRHPDHVEFGTNLTEDLRRRDFTMNALALDFSNGAVIDNHNGKQDIDDGIIRTIGSPMQRFSEDGLRPIRALRFASVLNFQIEAETKRAIHKTRNITAKISIERLQDEIVKSLKGNNPSTMLKLLVEEDILPLFLADLQLPSLTSLDTLYLKVLDSLPKSNLGFQIGVWCYCLQPNVEPSQWEIWLRKLKFSNATTKDAVFLLTMISHSKNLPTEIKDYEIRKTLLAPLKRHIQQRNLPFSEVWLALESFHWPWTSYALPIWNQNSPLLLSDLKINGRDLEKNYPQLPKPRYGELLNKLLDQVLRLPEKNEFSYLNAQCVQFLDKL
jgi:tRNA nucleotidyltransferase/poly(A) polymerase